MSSMKKIVLAGAGVLALVAGTTAAVLLTRPVEDPAAEAAARARAADVALREAAAPLLTAPGAHYAGWFANGDGQQVILNARATADGATTGHISVQRRTVDILDFGERTFVKSDLNFWIYFGRDAESGEFHNRWVSVPPDFLDLDFDAALDPAALAAELNPGIEGAGRTVTTAPATTVDGVAVLPVTVDGRLTYFVTTAQPRRLVKMSSADLDLTVTALTAEERVQTLSGAREEVAELRDAPDVTSRKPAFPAAEAKALTTELTAQITKD
jgi:hypothetical protein